MRFAALGGPNGSQRIPPPTPLVPSTHRAAWQIAGRAACPNALSAAHDCQPGIPSGPSQSTAAPAASNMGHATAAPLALPSTRASPGEDALEFPHVRTRRPTPGLRTTLSLPASPGRHPTFPQPDALPRPPQPSTPHHNSCARRRQAGHEHYGSTHPLPLCMTVSPSPTSSYARANPDGGPLRGRSEDAGGRPEASQGFWYGCKVGALVVKRPLWLQSGRFSVRSGRKGTI